MLTPRPRSRSSYASVRVLRDIWHWRRRPEAMQNRVSERHLASLQLPPVLPPERHWLELRERRQLSRSRSPQRYRPGAKKKMIMWAWCRSGRMQAHEREEESRMQNGGEATMRWRVYGPTLRGATVPEE
ncbi:unnamed protein product, partial [Symbiodinium sp. KB8]